MEYLIQTFSHELYYWMRARLNGHLYVNFVYRVPFSRIRCEFRLFFYRITGFQMSTLFYFSRDILTIRRWKVFSKNYFLITINPSLRNNKCPI